MQPLKSHKKCCFSLLDRLRHELARGEDRLKKMEAGLIFSRDKSSTQRHVNHYRTALENAERAALALARAE